MSGAVFPLADNQLAAANPQDNVWLSASAGTGKTQVLSARVLRLLLLPEVDPSQILCLTFTKAGAAEMANRINAVLARWVRLDPVALAKELSFLGADIDPDTQARARSLFASVIDCPGGGLRIDTIHAFSQWLIAKFPEEAGLTPGARPMEDRDRDLLARDVLAQMLDDGESQFAAKVANFAQLKDPDALRQWLMRCAGAAELWEGPSAWQPPFRERVLRLLDMPVDADENWAMEGLDPDIFPDDHILAMIPALEAWGTQTAQKCLDFLRPWLTLDLPARVEAVEGFRGTLLRADGEPALNLKKPRESDPAFAEGQENIADAVAMVTERRAMLELADFLIPALEMGRAFALEWEKAKEREGLLDFDDLIRRAALLLKDTQASDWIRYKLDRSFDHLLIDEAQDTNRQQWDIVFGLIDDFFSGDGARGDRLRTIFTVGDYKQAIFGFQGTSPDNFERAKKKVADRIEDARAHAHELREERRLPGWADLDLGRSYRTAAPVLDFVNHAIEEIGHEAFGLPNAPARHIGDDRAGLVTLWNPVTSRSDIDEEEQDQDWLPAHDTVLAEKIAEQVRLWVSEEEPFMLEKGERRHAGAGDIMVLVRKRKDLAAQIVAKLHAKGVAVAGVDRLRLGAPLAVKDLMAALRFAAQPLDDLSLANLLASPLIGWSQDDLLEYCPRDSKQRLWEHLRDHDAAFVAETVSKLRDLLNRADYQTPQDLLAWLLNGPWQSRHELVARLGREANDPIDELVNAAFAYQSSHTPSLAGFIQWFDAGDADLKRDSDGATGQVRVMTVHGSKGLQAPIVILADATGDPGQGSPLDLSDDPLGKDGEAGRKVPLPSLSKEQRVGPVEDAQEASKITDMQEHWRLLYVAMTRAEEALFIGGSLGPRWAEKGPPEDSWYARLEPLFDVPAMADPVWGACRELGMLSEASQWVEPKPVLLPHRKLPDWLAVPVEEEPRPPKPLAPSNLGEDSSPHPPLPASEASIAARRGTLIHALLERLPDVKQADRLAVGKAWLERNGDDLDEITRNEMLESAVFVISQPQFKELFSPHSLAEVPLSATIGGQVVTGTVDRLLIRDEGIDVVDFKTTRRPPERVEDIPRATLRQMAAYAAALAVIYPGRPIRAMVLYTQSPQLFRIPPNTLATHKQGLAQTQESYAPQHIE